MVADFDILDFALVAQRGCSLPMPRSYRSHEEESELAEEIMLWAVKAGVSEQFLSELVDGIRVLKSLAVVDGCLVADEIQAIMAHVGSWADFRVNELSEGLVADLELFSRLTFAGPEVVKPALARIWSDLDHSRSVLRSLKSVSVADDIICLLEREFIARAERGEI